MYQTAGQIFSIKPHQNKRKSNDKLPPNYKTFNRINKQNNVIENFKKPTPDLHTTRQTYPNIHPNTQYTITQPFTTKENFENNKEVVKIPDEIVFSNEKIDLREPDTWGPLLWFNLHNGAAKYPLNPTNIVRSKVIHFVEGLPYLIPCEDCAEHAKEYISENKIKLKKGTESRDGLFEFFYNFHDAVNKRLGKESISLEEAKKFYYD